MFSNFFRNILFKVTVNASSSIIHYRSKSDFKVTVMGASGGIGLPLCLQLKQCPLIEELSICDILNAHAVGDDIAFMDTKSKVTSYSYPGEANKAFTNARVVVMVAGVTRKPPMSREDLFKINAPIVMGVAENCVKYCPEVWTGFQVQYETF
ncbi:Malate dehydrogenase 1 [Blattella germanica]|nr:Malate dehydrogenase 1 [Blattella germanica]